MHRIVALALTLLVSACMTNPVPEGYTGPLAAIQDTFVPRSDRAADFFVLESVNGKKVDNALTDTTQRNYGRGFAMEPVGYARNVPASTATFTIKGRTHYAAPILELTNTVYQVKGDVAFTPAANATYIVRGVLGADYSAVWIEDGQTKAVIGNKVEIKGDASLGAMEK